MSTIASPRPSLTSLTTPSSSRRPSLDLPQNPPQRRNRAALRDYYGLKKPAAAAAPGEASRQDTPHDETGVRESELDAEGFEAQGYVKGVLAREGLEGVLRIEAGLINEIRGLDGETKALVYDNYSKLITATDTIRKMRSNMDPLKPTTSTLSPAISHIAETAASLSTALAGRAGGADLKFASGDEGAADVPRERLHQRQQQQQKERETVRWVLGAPRRLRLRLDAGKAEEAADDWREVQTLLGKWEGIGGVEEVGDACRKVMGQGEKMH